MLTLSDVRARYGLPSDADVFTALAGGETLPAQLYVAPEVHRLEQEKIFARAWQYACHDSRLATPGDVVLTMSGDIPIMIVHGLDGQLRHAPRQDREREFDCSAISLKPVSVERWDQFVFVNPDPDAAALTSLTDDIRPRTDELNADLKEYEYRVRYTYEMDCNWKVWAENAIECYHCPTTHRGSFGKTYDASPDAYETFSWRDTLWHEAPIKWIPGGLDPAALKGFRFAFLWPSSFFAVDDFIGFVGCVVPLGPERCWAFTDMYVRPGADESVVG